MTKITYIQKGKEHSPDDTVSTEGDINQLMTAKNLHFLMGAGTSATAVSKMSQMQKEFEKNELQTEAMGSIYKKIKYGNEKGHNLEEILGILHSAKRAKTLLNKGQRTTVPILIDKINKFIIDKIQNSDPSGKQDEKIHTTLELYKTFYRKTVLRNKDLSRANIFTTNYDLFNEIALDESEIDFNNGFSSGIVRYFNPARFHYTSSRKLDPLIEKYEPIERMVYLYKLHGSVSWHKNKNPRVLAEIVESRTTDRDDGSENVLIYPTPLKEGDTLASPYSDLMREFKSKLLLPHSVLFVIGYSFSDNHINKIIYQALSVNPSLTLFVLGNTQTLKRISVRILDFINCMVIAQERERFTILNI